jgi:hypothetical protein
VRPPAAKIPVLCDKRCSRDSEADGLKLVAQATTHTYNHWIISPHKAAQHRRDDVTETIGGDGSSVLWFKGQVGQPLGVILRLDSAPRSATYERHRTAEGIGDVDWVPFFAPQLIVLSACSDSVKVNGQMGFCAELKAPGDQMSVQFQHVASVAGGPSK